tara:strand:+ start:400 stop:666 length:267 start_codon:yes stop_codon:yes gene_type:complete
MINVNPTAEELNPTDSSILPVVRMEQVDAEAIIRSHRTSLLKDSDWVSALSIEKSTAYPTDWSTYREALRNIPQQTGFPFNVTWPTAP